MQEYTKDYLKNMDKLPNGIILNKTTEVKSERILNYLDTKDAQDLGLPYINNSYNSGIALYLPQNTKIIDPIKIEFNMDNKNPFLIDYNIIIAESGSEVTIIIDYHSGKDVEAFHNGLTKIYAKENSIINIIKLQRMNNLSNNFDSNIAFVNGNGSVNWISVEIGSSFSSSNYTTFLEGDASESNLSSVYLGDGTRKMDLEYSMIHKGPRSNSSIQTKGVLMDEAKKVFRGNLDFKRGARLSRGVEEEYVLLLDPRVKSETIPALLCEEDDVQGEHAASAGQIDKNRLFYLMSRGLSEKEAKKLIILASFRPVIDKIPSEDLRKVINDEIERRLVHA